MTIKTAKNKFMVNLSKTCRKIINIHVFFRFLFVCLFVVFLFDFVLFCFVLFSCRCLGLVRQFPAPSCSGAPACLNIGGTPLIQLSIEKHPKPTLRDCNFTPHVTIF